MLALPPIPFALMLDMPSVHSDCTLISISSLLEAPKQSIDLRLCPDAAVDFRARSRFPSRTASLDRLCSSNGPKIPA